MKRMSKKQTDEYNTRIQRLYDECLEELKELNIKPAKNIKRISINERAKKRLGCCRKTGNEYEIEVSSMLKNEDDKTIKEVIFHELLHTCKGCMNHGNEWKQRAEKINKETDYNITSTAGNFFKSHENENHVNYRYLIKCRKCGFETYRIRKSRVVENPENYRCAKCYGSLEVYEL